MNFDIKFYKQGKYKHFKEELHKVHVFYVPVAFVNSYEFQHRGLPYGHNVETMRHQDKPYTPSNINSVWAEIPDPKKYPNLFELVTQHMLHGSCGTGTYLKCTDNGKCFPKPFRDFLSHSILRQSFKLTFI